jgi:hypothetical protein
MKKFYSLIALAMMASTAFAASNGVAFRKGGSLVEPRQHTSVNKARAISKISEADLTGDIIDVAPEGETKYYSGASSSVYHIFSVTEEDVTGMTAEITFTADGKAYWKNPLSNAPFDTYIVGDVADSKITFQFPQHIYDDYSYADWGLIYEFYLAVYDKTVDEEGASSYDIADNQTITFSIAEDGTISQDGNQMIGMGDYDAWDEVFYFDGYGDQNIVLTPFNDTKVEAPETVVFEDWALTEEYNDNNKWLVKVGFDGNDVYVKGLCSDDRDMTFKGTIDGNRIIVPNGQYVGSLYYRYDYTQAGVIRYEYSDLYDREIGIVTDSADDFVFNYDSEARKLTSQNADCALLFSEGKNSGSYLTVTVNPTIADQGEITTYEPAAALITKAEDDWEWYEQIGLRFEVVLANVDGQLLPEENFGYEIYVDGELFTFTAGEPYVKLTEDLTEVPCTFSDDYDIQHTAGTDFYYVYFYFNTMKSLGVRMVYTTADGQKHYSKMSTLNVDFDGVEDITADKTVAGEEYFDLSGRRISGAANGFAIKRTTYTDGTFATSKVIR